MTDPDTPPPKRTFVQHGRLLLDIDHDRIASILENPERSDPPLSHPLSDMLNLPTQLQPPGYQKYVKFYKRKEAHYRDSYHAAARLPREQRPRSYFADLLRALAAGDTSAPRDLLEYRDVPRARSALAAATATIAPKHLPNYVQALASIAGARAITVLRRRLKQLMPDATRLPRWRSSDRITATICVAQHLVELDHASVNGAQALAAFLNHPIAWVRARATVALAEVFDAHAQTRPMIILRRGLEELVTTAGHAAFTVAADLLFPLHPKPVLERLHVALADGDTETRARAAGALLRIGARTSWPHLVQWFQREPSVHAVIRCAQALNPQLPPRARAALIDRAFSHPSPRVRLDAVCLLELLPSRSARRIVRRLASDEPDPVIKRRLLNYQPQDSLPSAIEDR